MISCFAIAGIENGWFRALFYTRVDSVLLWASKVAGYDVGRDIIKAVCSLYSNKTETENICFHAEDEAYLLVIQRNDLQFILTIYKLNEEPFNLISREQSELDNFRRGNVVFEASGQFKDLAQNICVEFSKYNQASLLKLYEGNWIPFPRDELEELKKIINNR